MKQPRVAAKASIRARTPKSIIHLISISFKFNSHEESPAREVNTSYLRVHIFMCSTKHIEIGLNCPKLDRTTRHRWKSSGSKRSNFQKDSYWFEVEQNCVLLRESSTNPFKLLWVTPWDKILFNWENYSYKNPIFRVLFHIFIIILFLMIM